MTADLGFSDRLSYVRWLRDMGRLTPENDRAFVAEVGIEYGWLQKWKPSQRSPTRRPEIKALVSGLASMGVTEDWLIDGAGEPPRPELWREWLAARSHHAEPATAEPEPGTERPALPGGARFEADYATPAARPSTSRRKKSG